MGFWIYIIWYLIKDNSCMAGQLAEPSVHCFTMGCCFFSQSKGCWKYSHWPQWAFVELLHFYKTSLTWDQTVKLHMQMFVIVFGSLRSYPKKQLHYHRYIQEKDKVFLNNWLLFLWKYSHSLRDFIWIGDLLYIVVIQYKFQGHLIETLLIHWGSNINVSKYTNCRFSCCHGGPMYAVLS